MASSLLPTTRLAAEGNQGSPGNTVGEGTLCQLASDLANLRPADDHEAFLFTFERVAKAAGCEDLTWAIHIAPFLTGEA